MPGLKGPRAAGGSGAVTHGLPARHTLCQGSALPARAGLRCPPHRALAPWGRQDMWGSAGTASAVPGVG